MLRRILSGLLIAAVTLGAVLLALEMGLRFVGQGDDAFVRPDPWTGWVLIPGHRADLHSEDPALGRRIAMRTDSLGLHDVERTAAKAPGVYRVLVLGDSYVQAAQVPLDSALTRRLERMLDRRGGRRVEVWNCGVDGYTTSQELLYLRHVASRYRADLVVLCVYAGNDIVDQVPALATSLRSRPFFRLSRDGLVLDRGHLDVRSRTLDWLRTHSRLYGWINLRRRAVLMNLRSRDRAPRAGPAMPGIPTAFEIYAERPDSLWSLAWNITTRLVLATRDEARRQGADFLLVSISAAQQESAESRRLGIGWGEWKEGPGFALDQPERRLARLAAASGIDYLPLLPTFREQQARTGRALHIGWVGHWNSEGHALAARLIAERIAARLDSLPPAGRPAAK